MPPCGPAAIYWPQQRPDRWLHPDYALIFLRNILHRGGRPQMGPEFAETRNVAIRLGRSTSVIRR